ncbi:MAG: hypothetical protein LBL49_05740 [Clostridiales Family XIII bacterium]|nr:hypothetical protein [Clostridiales Family XIII bacterium]
MAFCSNCGTFMPDGETVCKSCGRQIPPAFNNNQAGQGGAGQGNMGQPGGQQPPQGGQYYQQGGAAGAANQGQSPGGQFGQGGQNPGGQFGQNPNWQAGQGQFGQAGQGQYGQQNQNANPSGAQGFAQDFINRANDTADYTNNIDPGDINTNKIYGGLAYILFFLPLIICPNSKYGRFHANQSLLLVILSIAFNIFSGIIRNIFGFLSPLFFIGSLVTAALWLLTLALFVMGLVNGFSGNARELPIIGKYRIIK